MESELQIRVYRNRTLCHTTKLVDTLQIGRQRPGEPPPFHLQADSSRLIVAAIDDKLVSREHLQLRVVDAQSVDPAPVEVRNLSRKRSVMIDSIGKLGPQESVQLDAPFLVSFEDLAVRVEPPSVGAWEVRSLEHRTLAPGAMAASEVSLAAQQSIMQTSSGYDPQQLIRWLSELMGVLQSAAATSNFLAQAVDAVDRILRLDAIAALKYQDGEWQIESSKTRADDSGSDSRSPSRTILEEIRDKKSTVFHLPSPSAASASLQGVKALVASPILDPDSHVIGALYGARYSDQVMGVPQISEFEATMVEVIACSAAAGIAREKQQQKALEARIQFEQFFTPQLARELESNPHMLDGHEAEISVLFCDIVGFSAISQRIGSQLTMHWICDVMDVLSDAILANEGVTVDFIGDELMAMWGAPKKQVDHGLKACLAAWDILLCKSRIDQQWRERTGLPIDFRIGICSGAASVGNTGSNRRLKYGPLGNTVNLASRLQSAAKQFRVGNLISHQTAMQVTAESGLCCRPLGSAQFVNISVPIDVFELGSAADSDFVSLAEKYRELITLLRESKSDRAQAMLQQLSMDFPDDGPTQVLIDRLETGGIDASCIWPLDSK